MTIYTDTARFDTGRALTETEMRSAAPSIFAVTAHESRSERFQPIPTIEVLRELQKEGFVPVGVKQSTARDPGKAAFTKHLIRLRRIGNADQYRVGSTICEILLKNANDGSSAYDLMAGLFRIQCMNSLVAQTGTVDAVKVRHSGDVAAKVIEGTYRVLDNAQEALSAPADWSKLKLDREESAVLAEAAHLVRFGEEENSIAKAIEPERLLTRRTADDGSNDLWTTFNVVQENVIRGGLRGVALDANNLRRRVNTRAINGIDQDVKLNKALWMLAEKMAELKK